MASIPARISITTWGFAFLAAVLYWSIFPGDDPYRCRALIQTGRWVDPADENGDREPFDLWQPDGCLIHQYKPEDIRQCMDGRNFVFSGDSTIRQVAWGLIQLLGGEGGEDYGHLGGHGVWTATIDGQNVTYVWNPYVLLSGYWKPYGKPTDGPELDVSVFSSYFKLFTHEKENSVSKKDQKGPALVVFGGGAWYTFGNNATMNDWWLNEFTTNLKNVSDLAKSKQMDLYIAPFDPEDGIGNQAFFVPPSGPVVAGAKLHDPPEGFPRSGQRAEIVRMQDWLHRHEDDLNYHEAWALPATAEGQDKTFVEPFGNPWHYIDHISQARANILLNLRCNARLDRVRKYPTHRNCCTDYGDKSIVQQALIIFGLAFLVLCITLETFDMVAGRSTPTWRLFNMQSGGALILPLLMAYYADRTQIMGKGQKVWELSSFTLLCIPWVIIAFLTIQRMPFQQPQHNAITIEVNETFLSRSQTDEWKGWMQLVYIIYHWVNGDQSVPLTIFSAVIISAYLFLVGYEHTTYFLIEKNYSITDVARVLLRQNLLTCLLCHFMDTNYILYYYVMLFNFFFIAAWATMALGSKRWNDGFVPLSKICICAAVLACLVKFTPVIRWGLVVLGICFNVHWDAAACQSLLSRDMYIAFIGMILAVANHNAKDLRAWWRYLFAAVGLVALGSFWAAWLRENALSAHYWNWHEVAPAGPILAYVALRNVSETFRNYHSKAIAWVGQCSLELYLLHFHLFMAADNQGLLLTSAFNGDGTLIGDRWRDFIVVSPIFIWISSWAATGTKNVVEIILLPLQPENQEDMMLLSNKEEGTMLLSSQEEGIMLLSRQENDDQENDSQEDDSQENDDGISSGYDRPFFGPLGQSQKTISSLEMSEFQVALVASDGYY